MREGTGKRLQDDSGGAYGGHVIKLSRTPILDKPQFKVNIKSQGGAALSRQTGNPLGKTMTAQDPMLLDAG